MSVASAESFSDNFERLKFNTDENKLSLYMVTIKRFI